MDSQVEENILVHNPQRRKNFNSVKKKKSQTGMFWNSRGLRDLAKSTFLYDTSLEYDLDFVALLETNRKDFSNEVLTTFCGGRDFHWENSQS
ncbi:hypothetical protein ACJX0J_029578, partial [Zea mays]